MSIVYLNGSFIPIEKATVSVLDRGFLFADGVYEVIPVYNRCLFRFEEHLKRLDNSLAGIRLKLDMSREDWKTLLTELIEKNEGDNQVIYLQISRGAAPNRNHAFPDNIEPTIFATSTPASPPSFEELKAGTTTVTLSDTRRKNCNIKAISLLPNILLYQEALDAGAQEAILINDGYAIEGTKSNLFIVKDNEIITTPAGPLILGGITREVVIELARENNMTVTERLISKEELFDADEVWLSSSSTGIRPVVKIDDTHIANGQPGPLWETNIKLFLEHQSTYSN